MYKGNDDFAVVFRINNLEGFKKQHVESTAPLPHHQSQDQRKA